MKKKFYLVLVSLLMLITFVTLLWGKQLQQTIAVSMISQQQQTELLEKLEVSEQLEYELLFQKEAVPYDRQKGVYYLPWTTDEERLWEDMFSLSDETLSLKWCEDSCWENMEEAIAEGHEFSFLVSDDKYVRKGKIVFTGLPMMNLEIEQTLAENQYYCRITIFDPFHNDRNEVTSCYGYLELRGRTSKAFPKEGWDLDLLKENGTPYKTNLFGLREDDDWKLNALYPDASKVREMVAMELWNEIAEQTESVQDAGTQMEYFEMVLDDDFKGIYGAMEQLDYKQFSLDKNTDIIYKSYAWPLESHPERYEPEKESFGHLIKTGGRTITEELWKPLREYVLAAGFDTEEVNCDPEVFYQYIKQHMNLENFINAELFVQMLSAYDNRYKNFYLATDIRDDGDYTLWKIPWDLNYSFGDRFDVEANALTAYNLDWSQDIMEGFMLSENLLASGNEEFAQRLNARWQELKNGVFSVENVQRIAQENMELLIRSGAFARDEERWPEGPHRTSLEEILEFHSSRLNVLDEHYTSYLNEH